MTKDFIKDNIQAAVLISEALASTIGPKGMDKLLVDSLGDTFVTNDGATIIDKIELNHPIAKLIGEVAVTMNEEIGDGTTSAVVFTGELLRQANELINSGMHPSTIINGYEIALSKSIDLLNNKSINKIKEQELKELVKTSMTGKLGDKDKLSGLVIESVKDTPIDEIRIEVKSGKSIYESKVINGLLIDKEAVHPRMPQEVKNARILITNTPIEFRTTENKLELSINNPLQLKNILKEEKQTIKKIINSITESGANVILCQKGISEQAQELLARNNILAVRRVREKDINDLIKAANAELISDLLNIDSSKLGTGSIKTESFGKEKQTIIQDCPGITKTIIIRGGSEQSINEYKRIIEDSLGVINTIRKEQSYVPGAGSIEMTLSKELIKNQLKSREQLAINAFSNALRIIPKSLIRNSGQRINELITQLINKEGQGVNPNGGLINPIKAGIIEPTLMKKELLTTATQTAKMILRIDEILKGK